MHVLLVAYDFPPTPSPQALRWAYLVRELAGAGHQVEVITPRVPGYGRGGLPELPADVVVHRVGPGRLSTVLLGRKGQDVPESLTQVHAHPGCSVAIAAGNECLNWKGRLRKRMEKALGVPDGLNWKGYLAELIKGQVSARVFPDYRIEWVPFAVGKLDELLKEAVPDVVVVSHEPACTLPVGLAAAERGLPLAVDMGDPVLAPYTPPRWRDKAFALEHAVCRAACLVSVTTEAAAQLLTERHALEHDKLLLIRQGYDPFFVPADHEHWLEFDQQKLELLYTGSFYSFRRAEDLIEAVVNEDGVRLTVATISAPAYLVEAAKAFPDKIRLSGFLPHRVALAAQRACDVLLNIANADPVQVPGKVFEYLGAGKPVLHLRGEQQDATGQLLAGLKGGWEINSTSSAIANAISELRALKRNGQLGNVVAQRGDVQSYAWPELAKAWARAVEQRRQLAPMRDETGAML